MSDSAKIYAKPQLEIYADDVKCSHGATVGQLNAEEIYYMRQRGLSEADAKRLQVYGFVNEIISRVDNPKLTELLNELATAKIERM
jgi:Fe-S cluster assembly protein SufD